jgi:hypothetical protein
MRGVVRSTDPVSFVVVVENLASKKKCPPLHRLLVVFDARVLRAYFVFFVSEGPLNRLLAVEQAPHVGERLISGNHPGGFNVKREGFTSGRTNGWLLGETDQGIWRQRL